MWFHPGFENRQVEHDESPTTWSALSCLLMEQQNILVAGELGCFHCMGTCFDLSWKCWTHDSSPVTILLSMSSVLAL
jgi:hypothetical protein